MEINFVRLQINFLKIKIILVSIRDIFCQIRSNFCQIRNDFWEKVISCPPDLPTLLVVLRPEWTSESPWRRSRFEMVLVVLQVVVYV